VKKYRKRLCIGILCLVGLCVTTDLGLVFYFYLRTDNSPAADDSDLMLPSEAIPDADNAYVAFLALTNQLRSVSNEDMARCYAYLQCHVGETNSLFTPYGEYAKDIDATRVSVDRLLAEQATLFERLHEVSLCPRYRIIGEAKDGFAFTPLSDAMRAAQLWKVKACREMERGEDEKAFATIGDLFAFGSKLRDDPTIAVDMLVGSGICGMARSAALELSTWEKTSDAVLVKLDKLMGTHESDPECMFVRTCRREYSHLVGNLAGAWQVKDGDELVSALCSMAGRPGKSSFFVRSFARSVPGFVRFSFNPERTHDAYARAFRAAIATEDMEKAVPRVGSILTPNWLGALLTRMLAPVGQHLWESAVRDAVNARAVRTVIAVERYRRANGGAYPETLGTLVPEYLPSEPKDPFAPDRALTYDTTNRLVWSVGPEGVFDPFPARTNNLSRFKSNMNKYAVRLDGKLHVYPERKR